MNFFLHTCFKRPHCELLTNEDSPKCKRAQIDGSDNLQTLHTEKEGSTRQSIDEENPDPEAFPEDAPEPSGSTSMDLSEVRSIPEQVNRT